MEMNTFVPNYPITVLSARLIELLRYESTSSKYIWFIPHPSLEIVFQVSL